MSFQLKTDEILESLITSEHPQARAFQNRLEMLANEMAVNLAAHLGIECGEATFEGVDFAGTCCPFYPAVQGQELPECMAHYDDPHEWEPTE